MSNTDMAVESLRALAEQRKQEIRSLLLNPAPLYRWKADVPELRKQQLIILTRLSEMRRLLYQRREPAPLTPAEIEIFQSIVATAVDSYAGHLDPATDYADLLERALIEMGGPVYVHTLLLYEAQQDSLKSELRWSQYFALKELEDLLMAYSQGQIAMNSEAHMRAVDLLTFLSGVRGHVHHRHARARLQLKDIFLKRLAIVLTILIAILLLVIWGNAGKDVLRLAVTTAAAGALGSALTGVFKVRDELSRIGDLRLFGNVMIAQPLVGASAGLLLFMVLTTGLPGLGSIAPLLSSWGTFATYAFIAGFSEPFFLGVVQRVASTGDRKTENQSTRDAK